MERQVFAVHVHFAPNLPSFSNPMTNSKTEISAKNSLKHTLHEIIFEADTPAGKNFDVGLLILIFLSSLTVILESVPGFQEKYAELFRILEWLFTMIFTIEYLLRLYCVFKPIKYALSFYGIIDLLAILPTYLSLFVTGTHYLVVVRGLRLMRVFRIFKLGHFMKEAAVIQKALLASRAKITVFLSLVILLVVLIGSVMYLVEGGQNPRFSSIPVSLYWAIVTLTTVGYGDITPVTALGQFLSAVVMILGYAILAVPTGIVSAEMIRGDYPEKKLNTTSCPSCSKEGHDNDALFCKYCGAPL